MSNRPDPELVLDIRSYERVVVISSRDVARAYPTSWHCPTTLLEMLSLIGPDSVVIVDGADVTRRTYANIAERAPRLLAVTVTNEEHSRSVRKGLLSVQPWCDLHSLNCSIGRLVVAHRFCGRAYDRDALIDMRSGAVA